MKKSRDQGPLLGREPTRAKTWPGREGGGGHAGRGGAFGCSLWVGAWLGKNGKEGDTL